MKLILGVTGSIAAYKTFDIVRNWIKEGHEVKVILTGGALKFVKPELYTYLGALDVFGPNDDFNISKIKQADSHILHIDLARWCDRMIIAPASANTLSRLANGDASCLLTSVFLALDCRPVIIFPAMNSNMLNHPITVENIKKLGNLNFINIHPTAEGLLACGDFGQGKLPSVELISEIAPIIPIRLTRYPLKILISTGATLAPLDPVRYLTNPSSGLTGYYLARKFLKEGHEVTVIAGKEATNQLEYFKNVPSYKLLRVKTTEEMRSVVVNTFSGVDCYISAAAMCDIEFEYETNKMKKSDFNFSLNYSLAPDILQEVLAIKTKKQYIVGFAAESSRSEDIFLKKWQRKQVDLLVGNFVHSGNHGETPMKGFRTEGGNYYLIEKGKVFSVSDLSKEKLANTIYEKYVSYEEFRSHKKY